MIEMPSVNMTRTGLEGEPVSSFLGPESWSVNHRGLGLINTVQKTKTKITPPGASSPVFPSIIPRAESREERRKQPVKPSLEILVCFQTHKT